MHRYFLVIFLGCAGAAALGFSYKLHRVLPISTTAPSAIWRAPYDPRNTSRLVSFWEARIPTDPRGGINLRELSAAYLARYRETGDIADASRAERAARRSVAVMPRRNPGGYIRLAHALMAQHRFHEALRAAQQAASQDPNQNRLLADIYPDLGDYSAALKALSGVNQTAADPNYLALRARLLEIYGQQESALKLLQTAQHMADDDKDMTAERVAWYHLRVGNNLAMAGRDKEAETAFLTAINMFPYSYQAMSALARLHACRHEWASAIQWASKSAAIVPSPDVLATLGDAYAAQGQSARAAQQFRLIEAIGALSRAQGTVYDRQRAMYLADHRLHLAEALRLARRELAVRHDVYTYDSFAWVCYQNNKIREARSSSLKAIEHGTRDASLYFHAGVVAAATGQRQQAKKWLGQALTINSNFHPNQPATARALLSRLS